MKHGEGIETWPNGNKYNGKFEKNMRHGYGEVTWSDGANYQGEFYEDKR